MLSGLFSISSLLYSLNSKSIIPPQDNDKSVLIDKKFKKSALAGSLSGCILGLLPGLGPAQGTILAQCINFNKNITTEDFLVTNSGVNISDTLFSLISLYLINNPRSAISVYISHIMSEIDLIHIIFVIFVSLVSVSVSLIISIKIGDFFLEHLFNIEYNKLNIVVIVLISLIIIVFSFTSNACLFYVLLIYFTSISLGLICNCLDLSKSNLMGILIVPSIITYLGLI
jgi:putative membrane protein